MTLTSSDATTSTSCCDWMERKLFCSVLETRFKPLALIQACLPCDFRYWVALKLLCSSNSIRQSESLHARCMPTHILYTCSGAFLLKIQGPLLARSISAGFCTCRTLFSVNQSGVQPFLSAHDATFEKQFCNITQVLSSFLAAG